MRLSKSHSTECVGQERQKVRWVGFRARQTTQPLHLELWPRGLPTGAVPSQAADLAPGRYAVVSVPRSPQVSDGDRDGDGGGSISTGFLAHQGRVLADPRVSGCFQEREQAKPRLEAWGSLCSLCPVVSLPWS